MEIQLTKADLYQAVLETEASGIDTAVLCQRFSHVEPQRVHSTITKLVKESPPRLVRCSPGRVVAACYHASQREQINIAQERRLGIVVGSVQHRLLLALRAPGGMSSEQIYARFPAPSTESGRLLAAGLIQTAGAKEKQVTLTEKGRALVDPDGPLARRRTLNTYCQL